MYYVPLRELFEQVEELGVVEKVSDHQVDWVHLTWDIELTSEYNDKRIAPKMKSRYDTCNYNYNYICICDHRLLHYVGRLGMYVNMYVCINVCVIMYM